MAWKQDLAKLKQQLGPETPTPAPKAPPKPAIKPANLPVLADEDAVFLSAMGRKPSAPNPAKSNPSADSTPEKIIPVLPVPETFQEAVKDLKGLKPLARGLQSPPPPPPSPTPAAFQPPRPAGEPAPPSLAAVPIGPLVPVPEAPAQPSLPLRFQLAAGMAIEVDGSLDLRGHSLSDAMERLKDRLGDGVVLGWRSLQVTLGPDPDLHDGFLTLLTSGEASVVARYAQAPVPMGGTQAWLLYFALPPATHA
jgi:hypothetical protein